VTDDILHGPKRVKYSVTGPMASGHNSASPACLWSTMTQVHEYFLPPAAGVSSGVLSDEGAGDNERMESADWCSSERWPHSVTEQPSQPHQYPQQPPTHPTAAPQHPSCSFTSRCRSRSVVLLHTVSALPPHAMTIRLPISARKDACGGMACFLPLRSGPGVLRRWGRGRSSRTYRPSG
jgi:hypothetical protein